MGRVEEILARIDKLFPNAAIELKHTNPLELLIAVMLSAQSTDAAVNKTTESLFKRYKTLEDYIGAPLEDLEETIRSLGLYKNKAKNIQNTCIALKERFDGNVPKTQEELESLPGVGRKTANVVLSVLYGEPRIAVDTHVARVSKRLKIAAKKDTPRQVEEKLMKSLPEERWSKAHHQFIFFGRYHCTARRPKCEGCPLKEYCRYPDIHV